MNFKSFLPSLILVAIYFIADEFFGPVAGVICAILLGTGEFIYTRFRERRTDKMIVLTTLFFCIPGAIAILSEGSAITRLQPAIIECALCILLGVMAFSKNDLTAVLPAGYRKNIHLTDGQLRSMRRMIRTLFFIILCHTLLSFTALSFLSESAGSFVSGPLLYILMGAFFIYTFIHNRLTLRRMLKNEEWLPVVNEKGEVTDKALRSVCHSGARLLHPVVHLHITNERHDFFLQKRSMKKDLLPGMWDTAVGGHIGLNEKVEDALKRETFEELGITDFQARFIGSYVWESPREKELVFSFLCTGYNSIHIANDEVDEGHFWSAREIEEGIRQKQLTPNFIHEYRTLLSRI